MTTGSKGMVAHGARALICLVSALAVPAGAPAAPAPGYPAKLIRLVTGSTAGGAADITARQIAPRLAESLGQQIIVDNRPGVAGMIANEYVSKAAADGYTILLQPASFMMVTSILNTKGAWNPTRSLAPVAEISTYGFVLAVHPSMPVQSVQQFVALARSKPRGITFASTGVGSNFHLAGALFNRSAKVELWHVPYKGSPPAIVDLVAGRVDAMFTQVPPLLDFIRSGRLRALAVTSTGENPLLPGVPPMATAGLPGYEITGSEWIVAPAGTPRDVLVRLNGAVAGVLEKPELRELWRAKGAVFVAGNAEESAARFTREYDRTAALIRDAGVRREF